jgi:hypothetical protein
MEHEIYLAKWKDGSFTFLFGASNGMFDALDRIGPPSEAEVKVLPWDLMNELYFNQKKGTCHFEFSDDVEGYLWHESTKQVWPLEALGS